MDFVGSSSVSELLLVNKIKVSIIPDEAKQPPSSVARGLVGGAILGATLGGLGALIYMSKFSGEEARRNANKWAGISAGAGALAGALGVGIFLKVTTDNDAYVFKDFLIANSQVPIMPDPQ